MQLDPKPFFRRVIPPWYDTDAVCYTLIVFMVLSLLFGIQGLYVALHAGFSGHAWVPVLLILLSLSVILSASLRLVQRRRRSQH